MKKISKILYGFVLLCGFTIFTLNVQGAINSTSSVSSDISYGQCIDFQNSSAPTSTHGYFGYCVKATCNRTGWSRVYYDQSSNLVPCANGNPTPYYQLMKTGCGAYPIPGQVVLTGNNTGCRNAAGTLYPFNHVKYCTELGYYDCSKTTSGAAYTTTTKKTTTRTTTKKPTTKKTTTSSKKITTSTNTTTSTSTTTEPIVPPIQEGNTYLASLKIEPGSLNFDKTVESYTIEVDSVGTAIAVTAVPEDLTSTVKIENNEAIDVNYPIVITITATDGSTRVYMIHVQLKNANLETNSRLSSIEIVGYENDLGFHVDIYSYDLNIADETELEIKVEPEGEFAQYRILGNANLKNKSQIKIIVTAEDPEIESTYLITIHKSANSNLIGILIVVIILGIAGFVGIKLIKKMLGNRGAGETQYEYE